MEGTTITTRDARAGDARAVGAVHAHAGQRAYRGGLMPDDYLDGLSVDHRRQMWDEALARTARTLGAPGRRGRADGARKAR